MTNNQDSGNAPQTIDAAGNIIPKPYGVSRWYSPRIYACTHAECPNPAVSLKMGDHVHNCCNDHEETP